MDTAVTASNQDLLDALDKVGTLDSYRCEVILGNITAPSDQVVVVAAGIKFFFDDGGEEMMGPYTLNLGPNQRHSFYSSDDTRCVKSFFLAGTATIRGRPQQLTHSEPPVADDMCLTRRGIDVRVRPAVLKAGGGPQLECVVS